MDTQTKEATARQLGAAIDMLEDAIRACPEELWDRPMAVGVDLRVGGGRTSAYHRYWYIAYHTLFFLDYYLSEREAGFAPPEPFGLSELDPEGAFPDRVYDKDELIGYLAFGRTKALAAVGALTGRTAHERAEFGRPEVTRLEMVLYVLRHVQHHAAQLDLLLRQAVDGAPRWVGKARG